MNSGNSCKNLCVRVRVCVRAAERLVCSRRRLGRGETRGKLETLPTSQWVCAAVRPRSRARGWRGSLCGDTGHGHVRELLWQEAAPGSMPASRPCRGDTPRTQNHVQNSVPEHWLGAGGAAGRGMFSPRTSRFPAAHGFPGSSRLRLSPGPAIPASGPAPSCSAWALLGPMPRALPALPRWLQPLPVEIPPLPLSWQLVGVQRLYS